MQAAPQQPLAGTARSGGPTATALSRELRGQAIVKAVTALGIFVLVLLIWQGLADLIDSLVFPSLSEVLRQFHRDGLSFYGGLLKTTSGEAFKGWLIGNGLGIAVGLLCITNGIAERIILRVSIVTYSLPIIAIGPIFVIMLHGSSAMVALAAMSVFFVTLVGTLVGLNAAPRQGLDVVNGCGGGTWAQLRKVRIWAALPGIFSAIKISIPSAMTAAIVGEYMSGRGALGVAMLNSQQQLEVTRTWCLTLVAAAASAAAYGVAGLIERQLTPWARMGGLEQSAAAQSAGGRRGIRRLLVSVGGSIIAGGVVFGAWELLAKAYTSVSIVVRTPAEVVSYLFTAADAAQNRSGVFGPLGTTLKDALIGYAAGTIAACLVASLFVLMPSLGRAMLPYAVTLRTIPLVALTPLLIPITGTSYGLIASIGAIVTFFPTLVNVGTGLRSAPQSLIEVAEGFGASRLTVMRKVTLVSALPMLLVSARVSVPLSIVGALLAEWFGTGQGMGAVFAGAVSNFEYDRIWACVAIITLASTVIYSVVSAAERQVLGRFAT